MNINLVLGYNIISYSVAFLALYSIIFFLLVYIKNRKEFSEIKETMKKKPLISVIIPAFNEEKTIAKTIQSVLNSNYPKNKLEIIVVDDGSKDKTVENAKKVSGTGIKVFSKPNTGKADSLNYGIKKAKGEFIATMDADSYVTPEAINRMLPYFDDPRVGAVTASIKVHNKQNFLEKLQNIEYIYTIFTRKVLSLIDAVNVTPGPFSLFRKKTFDLVGGFDPQNIMEDQEMALRIQLNNLKICSTLDAEVYTQVPRTFGKLLNQRIRWHRGGIRNAFKHRQMIHPSYGDFGVFVMPLALFAFILVLSIITAGIARTLEQSVYFQLLGPEMLPIIATQPILLIGIAILALTIAWVHFALKNIKGEKIKPILILLYAVTYMWLITLFWAVSLYKELTGAKLKW
jgi:cellulose synthase/poly-beta-1,6-N-acetylglucosamine synthase-like glycosyltransferase